MAQTILVDGTPVGYLPNGNASDVEYDNTQSGLSATNTQDAIDEINADIADVSVKTIEIVADGTKTYTQLLNELFTAINNANAFSANSRLVDVNIVATNSFLVVGSQMQFGRSFMASSQIGLANYYLASTGSSYTEYRNGAFSDYSANVVTSGRSIKYQYI